MIRVVKITEPDCIGCMGASFGDCTDCKTKTTEITLCKDCVHLARNVGMYREKMLCDMLHAWVEPYEFCAWGEVNR